MVNILIPKETRAGETRVALIPDDVSELIRQGHKVYIEHDAGNLSGFSDQDYQNQGAEIRFPNDVAGYAPLFKNINLIVRVKRPDRQREIVENQLIAPGTFLIGALDPLEKNLTHMQEYKDAGIKAFSIDQLNLPSDDPMNILAAMSKIAGKLALLDAIDKFHGTVRKIVIIGFGMVGRAAFHEAINQKIPVTVALMNDNQISEVEKHGGKAILLSNNLLQQQEAIKEMVLDVDVVITSARKNNEIAPLLIPQQTLAQMKKGSVIVDMALSEGGNVEGSEHDATHILGNGVLVTNTSGYPKAKPHEASILWSKASTLFILKLLKENS